MSSSSSASSSSRGYFIGGNWKSNGTKSSVSSLVSSLNSTASSIPSFVEVVVAPTYLHIDYVLSNIKSPIQVSAQNCNFAGTGAYTGELAAVTLKDFGLNWVILGHSERRQYYSTTDEVVAKQIDAALKADLKVIACIGETLAERKADKTMEVVIRQLKALVSTIGDKWNRIVIAYEPVWAIGTGQVATPEQAQEVHSAIRKWIASDVSASVASSVRIIYGGSVNGKNAESLVVKEDIDGFLVGGASLIGDDFAKIIAAPGKIKGKL